MCSRAGPKWRGAETLPRCRYGAAPRDVARAERTPRLTQVRLAELLEVCPRGYNRCWTTLRDIYDDVSADDIREVGNSTAIDTGVDTKRESRGWMRLRGMTGVTSFLGYARP